MADCEPLRRVIVSRWRHLLNERSDDAGVAVALVHRRVRREAVCPGPEPAILGGWAPRTVYKRPHAKPIHCGKRSLEGRVAAPGGGRAQTVVALAVGVVDEDPLAALDDHRDRVVCPRPTNPARQPTNPALPWAPTVKLM